MKPIQIKTALTGCVAALAMTAFVPQVLAMDELEAWSSVATEELGTERGQGATNLGSQTVEQQVVYGDTFSGNINLSTRAFDGQKWSINAFNSGNNVMMQNQFAIEVNMY